VPVAAAVWFDQTTPTSRPAEPDPRCSEIFGPDLDRWRTLEEATGGHHLHGPHHYLLAIGVHPDLHGRGLGSRLLTHRHPHVKPHPAYLEATSPDSRRLYQRLGYHDLGELHLPDDGPTLWRMWRPTPATPHRSA
jgi:GNAT superfamily N-acetyltransferase